MNQTFALHIIGKLTDNARGKRLIKSLAGTPAAELPGGVGLCLANGQDYQTRTPAEQRQWLAWAARPGCTLLLVPPFQTAGRHEPNGWEIVRLDNPPILDHTAHLVPRLTLPEINVTLARGLAATSNPVIDGGTRIQLNGLFRKHPDSGIFAVTAVPVWSLALADAVPALVEWLSAWVSLSGHAADITQPASPTIFEPTQSHYSALLYLASGHFASRAAALEALAWNDTFEFSGDIVPTLLDQLQDAGLISDGSLSDAGRQTLLASPYRAYAEACLKVA